MARVSDNGTTFDEAPAVRKESGPKCADVGVIAGWLKALVGASTAIELRAIDCDSGPRVRVEHYPATSEGFRRAAEDARRLSRRAEGVYFAINPITDDILSNKGASDADVVRRQWLFIDVDPVRPARVSSTDVEKIFAWTVAASIRDDLAARGLDVAALIDSGNGFHLYYPIDLPADDAGIVEGFVKALAKRYNTQEAKVDTSVFNPSRIAKVPGTLARKGEATAERPHRSSFVMECYPVSYRIPAETLIALTREFDPEGSQPKPAPPIEVPTVEAERTSGRVSAPAELTVEQRAILYLEKADPAVEGQNGSNQTLKTACAIGPGFDLDPEAAYRILAEHYNPKCDPPWSEKELRRKVDQAYKRESRRGWLLGAAKQGESLVAKPTLAPATVKPKAKAPTCVGPSGLVEHFDDERRLARLFVDRNHSHPDRPALLHWQNAYHAWDAGAWRIVEDSAIRSGVTRATKEEFERIALETGEPVEKVPRGLVLDVDNMLKSMVQVSTQDVEDQPEWLGVPGPSPLECLNCRNGILHIPSYIEHGRTALIQQTPNFFTPYVLDYPFLPDAPEPIEWFRFLDSIWPGDEESKRALQQWFGYLLTPDTSQHAILLITGPPRCGKGTILRVLQRLIGDHNCVAPHLDNLGTQYGSWSLVGKSLAYFGETRFGGRSDVQAILDRILSISGEDKQTIPRKFMSDWTGRLTTRFAMLTNDLPSLGDRSGALMSRLKILKINESFVGREDRDLSARLERECPSILHWAIQGWEDLRKTGCLIQPAAGREARDEMAEITNPVIPFTRDHIIIGGYETTRETLYERWQLWCKANGRDKTGDLQRFVSSLRSHLDAMRIPYEESRPRSDDGSRVRVFRGIGLRPLGPNGAVF